MTDEQAVVVREEHAPTLWDASDPRYVVDTITGVADVLKAVIRQNRLSSTISNREFVRVEGWTMLAPLLQAWPHGVPQVRPLVNDWCDEHHPRPCGYEAEVELRRADGSSVGGGIAECSRHEKTWRARDDYALKSMAQTRALGKAYRMSFGFVMAAAGYETTPAEEVPADDEDGSTTRPRPQSGWQGRPSANAGGTPQRAAPKRRGASAPSQTPSQPSEQAAADGPGKPGEVAYLCPVHDDLMHWGRTGVAGHVLADGTACFGQQESASAETEVEPAVTSVRELLVWAEVVMGAHPQAVVEALGAQTIAGIADVVRDQYGGTWDAVQTTLLATLGPSGEGSAGPDDDVVDGEYVESVPGEAS